MRYFTEETSRGYRFKCSQTEQQQKLTPQQEDELVKYIGMLTERGLPPTRAMMQIYASVVTKD
jgi:hypothetical protein